MPSARSIAIRHFHTYFVKPRLSATIPVAKQRKSLNTLSKIVIMPRNSHFQSVMLGNIKASWVSAATVFDDAAILYLHGGAYAIGSPHTHRALTSYLSKTSGTKVLAIDYRLAPEYPYPAAVEDSVAAYKWLLDSGYQPDKIVIAGDSAGGGLSLATVVALRDSGISLPQAVVCFSPWADLEGTGQSFTTKVHVDPVLTPDWLQFMAKLYAGNTDLQLPRISPLYADFHGFPPVLIQVGSEEILLSDSQRLAERMKTSGVKCELEVLDDMYHTWSSLPGMIPEANQAMQRAGVFIRKRIGKI
ncbi:MAG: alpha/beta hydrolase [Proteobacteria bacterium]|nr:alpha/beta hydrolase [Pseudomonadota bacterium]